MLLTVPLGRSFLGCGTTTMAGRSGCTKTWWLPLIRSKVQPHSFSFRMISRLLTRSQALYTPYVFNQEVCFVNPTRNTARSSSRLEKLLVVFLEKPLPSSNCRKGVWENQRLIPNPSARTVASVMPTARRRRGTMSGSISAASPRRQVATGPPDPRVTNFQPRMDTNSHE